jgi:hypothetical protein
MQAKVLADWLSICSYICVCLCVYTIILEVMKQRTLKNVNDYLNTNIYSCLETSVGQSFNLYLNAVHFFNTSLN